MGNVAPSYKGFRFPAEIISHCVWLYHRFPLSLREVQEMMAQRGIIISHETVRQWCQKFGQTYANGPRHRRPHRVAGGSGAGAMTTTDGRSRSLYVPAVSCEAVPLRWPWPVVSRSSSRPSSEIGRRRGARGSGPFPSAFSRTGQASFPASGSPVFISGWWLWSIRRGCSGGIFRRPRGSCVRV